LLSWAFQTPLESGANNTKGGDGRFIGRKIRETTKERWEGT